MSSLKDELSRSSLTEDQLGSVLERKRVEKFQKGVVSAEDKGAPADIGFLSSVPFAESVLGDKGAKYAAETMAKMSPLISLGGTVTDILGVTEGYGQKSYELGRAYQAAAAESKERDLFEDPFMNKFSDFFGDAIAQLPSMAVGALGRGKGTVLLYGLQEANSRYREALSRGAPVEVATEQGIVGAAIEMGFTGAFGRIQKNIDVDTILGKALKFKGAAGKKVGDVSKDIQEATAKSLMKIAAEEGIALTKDTAWEVLEEASITAAGQALDYVSGFDEEALDYNNMVDGAGQAAAVSIILNGMIGGPVTSARIAQRYSQQPKQESDIREEVKKGIGEEQEVQPESQETASVSDESIQKAQEVIQVLGDAGAEVTPDIFAERMSEVHGVGFEDSVDILQQMSERGLLSLDEESGLLSLVTEEQKPADDVAIDLSKLLADLGEGESITQEGLVSFVVSEFGLSEEDAASSIDSLVSEGSLEFNEELGSYTVPEPSPEQVSPSEPTESADGSVQPEAEVTQEPSVESVSEEAPSSEPVDTDQQATEDESGEPLDSAMVAGEGSLTAGEILSSMNKDILSGEKQFSDEDISVIDVLMSRSVITDSEKNQLAGLAEKYGYRTIAEPSIVEPDTAAAVETQVEESISEQGEEESDASEATALPMPEDVDIDSLISDIQDDLINEAFDSQGTREANAVLGRYIGQESKADASSRIADIIQLASDYEYDLSSYTRKPEQEPSVAGDTIQDQEVSAEPRVFTDEELVDIAMNALADSTPAPPVREGKRVGDRKDSPDAVSTSERREIAAKDLAESEAELLDIFKRKGLLGGSSAAMNPVGLLADEEIRRGIAKYIVSQVRHKNAVLKDVIAGIAGMIGDANTSLIKDPIVNAWNSLSSPQINLTKEVSPEEASQLFAQYERAAEDASDTGDGGLEGGREEGGMVSGSGRSSSDQVVGEGDGLGDVSQQDVVQDAVDGEAGRTDPSGLRTGVEGADGDGARTGQQQQAGESPTDSAVSSEVAREDGAEQGRLPDESQGDQGGRGRDRDVEPSDVVSRVSDVDDAKSKLVKYEPANDLKSINVFVPSKQAAAVRGVLNSLKKRRGDLKAFVSKETGIPLELINSGTALFAEQLDAVALAIDAHKRGLGFVLGDMTGIGKGRVVASLIGYSIKQGKVPVFVTAKPGLYAPMMEDLAGIGLYNKDSDINPLVTNSMRGFDLNENLPGRRTRKISQSTTAIEKEFSGLSTKDGKIHRGNKAAPYDVLFTNYSQIQPSSGSYGYKAQWIRDNAKDLVFILDESHRAAGPANPPPVQDEYEVSIKALMDEVLPKSAGQFFSSATHAKSGASMSLYKSIGLLKSIRNPRELAQLFKKGKDPLLQVTSEMAAGNGGFLRRERDFEGIDAVTVPVATDRPQVNSISSLIKTINSADKQINRWAESQEDADGNTGVMSFLMNIGRDDLLDPFYEYDPELTDRSKIRYTPFKSKIGRVVDTASVILKAEDAADEAIAAFKRGEKPIIAFDATLASALSDFAESQGVKIGDEINFTYSDILNAEIQKLFTVDYATPYGEKKSVQITKDDLPSEIVSLIEEAEQLIVQSRVDELPGSPIDFMIQKLEAAGMKVGELTGRNEVISNIDGKNIYSSRRQSAAKKNEVIAGYNSGELDGLLINPSAAEGFSMHSSASFKDQRQRTMIVVKFANNIAHSVQILGRINRTGQVVPPSYRILFSDMPAERRPMSMFMKKLKSLNANVTADTETDGVSVDVPETINQVGQRVMISLIDDMRSMEGINLQEETGVTIPASMRSVTFDHTDATWLSKFTGSMFLLDSDLQERIWNEFEERFASEIKELNAAGANPLEAKTLELDAKTIESRTIEEDSGKDVFEQGFSIETVNVAEPNVILSTERIKELSDDYLNGESPESFQDSFLKELDSGVDEYYTKESDRINSLKTFSPEQKIDSIRKTHDIASANINIIKEVSRFTPGSSVAIETTSVVDGETYTSSTVGIVIGYSRKRRLVNPTSLSQYELVVAVPDSRVTMEIPFASIGVRHKLSEGPVGDSRKSLEQVFEDRSSSVRMVRSIATGNILRAYEALSQHGNVVFYTDSTGAQKSGVLLDRGFDIDEWLSSRPIEMPDGKSAYDLISEDGLLATFDEGIKVYAARVGSSLEQTGVYLRLSSSVPFSMTDSGRVYFEEADAPASIGSKISAVINKSFRDNPDTTSIKRSGMYVHITGDKRYLTDALQSIVELAKHHSQKGLVTDGSLSQERARRLGIGQKKKTAAFETKADPSQDHEIIEAELVKSSYVAPLRSAASDQSINVMNTVIDSSAQNILQGMPDANHPVVQAQTLVNTLDKIFKVSSWIGIINPKRNKKTGVVRRGQFRDYTNAVEITDQSSASITTRIHEIAHALDKRHNITGQFDSSLPVFLAGNAGIVDKLGELDYEYPNKRRAEEGWAEFVRRYLTETEVNGVSDLRNNHKEVVEWFENDVAKAFPEIKRQFDEAERYIGEFASSPAFARVMAQIGRAPLSDARTKKRIFSKITAKFDELRTKYSRSTLPIHRVDKSLEDFNKKRGYTNEQAIIARKYTSSAQGQEALMHGVFYPETGGSVASVAGEGLIPYIQSQLKTEEEYDEMEAFAYLRHVVYVDAQGFAPEYQHLVEPKEASRILSAFKQEQKDKYDRYTNCAIKISRTARELQKMKMRSGVIGAQFYQFSMDRYGTDNYFPMFRIPEEGGDEKNAMKLSMTSGKFGVEFTRSKYGSGKAIESPLVSMWNMSARYYKEAQVALTLRDLDDSIDGFSDDQGNMFATIVDPMTVADSISAESQVGELVKRGLISDRMRDAAIAVNEYRKWLADTSPQKPPFDTALMDTIEDFLGVSGQPDAAQKVSVAMSTPGKLPDISGLLQEFRQVHLQSDAYHVAKFYDRSGNAVAMRLTPSLYDLALTLDAPIRRRFGGALDKMSRIFRNSVIGWSLDYGIMDVFVNQSTGDLRATYIKSKKSRFLTPFVLKKEFVRTVATYAIPELYRSLTGRRGSKDIKSTHLLYKRLGGSQFSIVGSGREKISKYVKKESTRGLRKSIYNLYDRMSSFNIGGAVSSVLDQVEYVISLGDAPMRLANMEAYLEEKGYSAYDKNGKVLKRGTFYDKNDDLLRTDLPREILIGAATAAGSANHNFKYRGSVADDVGIFLPFFASTMTAAATDINQIKDMLGDLRKRPAKLFSGGDDDERIIRSRRLLAYIVITGMYGYIHHILRRDDEDYANAGDENQRYWTFGHNGKTWLRLKKNMGMSFASNTGAAVAEMNFGTGDLDDVKEVLLKDLYSKAIPYNPFERPPGGFVGGVFQALSNKDSWGRPIASRSVTMSGRTPSYMFEDSTRGLYKFIGEYTGMTGIDILGPVYLEHIANQSFGNIPEDMARLLDVFSDPKSLLRKPTGFIPGVGSMFPGKQQLNPVYELREQAELLNSELADLDALGGKMTERYQTTLVEFEMIKSYSDLVYRIQRKGWEDKDRQEEYNAFANGVARLALNLEETELSPNLFEMNSSSVPEAVVEATNEFIADKTSKVFPVSTSIEMLEGESYVESKNRLFDLLNHRMIWLEEHLDSPFIRDSMVSVLRSKDGVSKLRSIVSSSRPNFDPEMIKSKDEYLALLNRWIDLKKRSINVLYRLAKGQ
jgi:hypothetical protein